jgi:hypothetical protein
MIPNYGVGWSTYFTGAGGNVFNPYDPMYNGNINNANYMAQK